MGVQDQLKNPRMIVAVVGAVTTLVGAIMVWAKVPELLRQTTSYYAALYFLGSLMNALGAYFEAPFLYLPASSFVFQNIMLSNSVNDWKFFTTYTTVKVGWIIISCGVFLTFLSFPVKFSHIHIKDPLTIASIFTIIITLIGLIVEWTSNSSFYWPTSVLQLFLVVAFIVAVFFGSSVAQNVVGIFAGTLLFNLVLAWTSNDDQTKAGVSLCFIGDILMIGVIGFGLINKGAEKDENKPLLKH